MAGMRNAEGYFDPTAGTAIRNIEREERRRKSMSFKRGDIYYVERSTFAGSEQAAGRPAVIVSNNKNNEHSDTVEVVYLTTQPKNDLPTHVLIRSLSRESIAICEQITTVSKERMGNYKGRVTDSEMMNIEIAMLVSLDMQMGAVKEKVVEVVKEVPVPDSGSDPKETAELALLLAAEKAKCDMLQAMYDTLLGCVVGSNTV